VKKELDLLGRNAQHGFFPAGQRFICQLDGDPHSGSSRSMKHAHDAARHMCISCCSLLSNPFLASLR
jgi:hypothetical protein